MKIIDRVKAVSEAFIEDGKPTGTGGTLAFPMKSAAILAALGGINSKEWRDFMSILACNEDQLKRLTGADAFAKIAYVRESSAYLVTNSTCGGHTPQRLPEFVDERIDDQLNFITDPNFVRVIDIKLPPKAPAGDQPAPPSGQPTPTEV